LDYTLVRKYGIYWPTVTWNTEEWDVLPKDNFDYIGYHNTSEVLPTSVTISGDTEVVETETIELVATVLPVNALQTVTWTSLDPSIATVDENTGLVTGVSEGTVIIKATSSVDSNLYDEYEITVSVQTFYTVQFDLNGGNSAAIENQTIANGGLVNKPSNPTHVTDNFAGWFTQASGGSEWDFNTNTVAGNMTLYAQWSEGVVIKTATIDSSGSYSSGISNGIIPSERLSIVNTGSATVTVGFYKNNSTTITIFNNSSGEIRLYGKDGNGGQLNISVEEGSYLISEITIKTSTNNGFTINGGSTITASEYTLNFETAEDEVIIKNVATGTLQVRITEITITYIPG
jgi:uncharacterized repeat protein (TIGR02543 family)